MNMLFEFFVLAGFSMPACIGEKYSNYYMETQEASEEDVTIKPQTHRIFKAYWNVPTSQCKPKGIYFENLSHYGIIQNENDKFRQGDKMTILYDPGLFPAMFHSTPNVYRHRNGGVPQEGSIQKHLDALKGNIDEIIPNKDYAGIAVINFESWRPIFHQNNGNLKPYIDVSYDIERKGHWWWPLSWIETTARERYERAARNFMESSLRLAKKMRPNAKWGYYAYPYCFNRGVDYKCSNKTMEDNDGDAVAQEVPSFYEDAWDEYGSNFAVGTRSEIDSLDWLWSESTGLFPLVSTSIRFTSSQLEMVARAAVSEAARVSRGAVILPYISFSHTESSYYSQKDLELLLDTIYNSKADGVIVGGASKDVNTKTKCRLLLDYITKTFGPVLAQFTKGERRQTVESITNNPFTANTMRTNQYTTTIKHTIFTHKHTRGLETGATEMFKNTSDFIITPNKDKQDSIGGERILDTLIQFLDMAEANSSFYETSEQQEFNENLDLTENEIEQELKSEIDSLTRNYESSLSLQRKYITSPMTLPITNTSINWKKFNASLGDIQNTTVKIVTFTSPETIELQSTVGKLLTNNLPTVSANKKENNKIETSVTPKETIQSQINIVPDYAKANEEFLESLFKLSGSIDEFNSPEFILSNKTINDDKEATNTTNNIQDLAAVDHETDNLKLKIIIDNQSNDFKQTGDDTALENKLDSQIHSKTNYTGQEMFEDDLILQAVAEILNATDTNL